MVHGLNEGHDDGLVQERRNSSALAMELRLSCINPSIMHLSKLIEAEWRIYASVKHTNIASDNGLSPIRRQAIIWTNAVILLIRPQGTYFSEILFETRKFSFKKMHLKMSSAKWRPFCLGLNVK